MLRLVEICGIILAGGLEACTIGWGQTNGRGISCLEH